MIADRYKLHNKINSGSFGEIHLVTDTKTKRTLAAKMQLLNIKHPQLQYQAKLFAYLTFDEPQARQKGLPKIHFYGKFDKYHVMIMDLLGPSLQQLFQRCNKKFDLKTVVMIGTQIFERIKTLHRRKYIHRDIKPQNFLLGLNQYCATIFMIDLGLSKKYIQKNGQHIPYRDDRSLKGTPRYTSLNSHLGIQQSRRDDLESIVYMLIYFLKGQLPWQNLKQDAHYDRYERILQRKLAVSVDNLTIGLPKEFRHLVEYTRGLHFVEQPNYDMILGLLQQALNNQSQQIRPNDLFCWEKSQEELQQPKRSIPQKQMNKPRQQSRKQSFQDFDPFNQFQIQKKQVNAQHQKTQQSDFSDPFQSKNLQASRNPFDSYNGGRKDSLDQSDDPNLFKQSHAKKAQNKFGMGIKTQRSEDSYDPFGSFDKDPRQQQLEDPFADPDIVEL